MMTIFKFFITLLCLLPFLFSVQKSPRKVIGREIYTSSQPSIKEMENFISKYKISTVINLRGENKKNWYLKEKEMLKARGVELFNIKLSANRVIPRYEILKIFHFYNNLKYPLLIHCKHGFDRSYFFLTLIMKLEGREVEKRYFFMPKIWDFFKEYEKYLKEKGLKDGKETFYHYLKYEYVPEDFKYDLIFEKTPLKIEKGKELEFEAKVKNRSNRVWILNDNMKEGVRLGVRLFGPFEDMPENLEKFIYEEEKKGVDWGRAGIENGKIFPEETKYFKFLLPLPDKKGKYFFAFDMVEENVAWFHYYGKPPYFYTFEVD
ncbi:MAG: hypothetical protein WHV67_03285 [Thermoanaerobaculia bacterium]